MIGEKIRAVRQSQGRSLADVAGKAKISVATLSRIETDKQAIDVDLLMVIAEVLGIDASDVLVSSENGGDALAHRISNLGARERAELWRDLTAERRAQRGRNQVPSRNLSHQIEEMVAQLDFVREELETLRMKVKKSR